MLEYFLIDKWIPVFCITFSAVFALTAYFLWFNNTSVVSDTITQKDSKEEFASGDNFLKKTKILIVPGHDSDDYGARFNDLKEEELNLELAENLFKLLSKENSFEVFITRDKNGYKETFDEYFKQEEKINNFIYENKIETKNKTNSGQFEPVNVVEHNLVGEDIALKLYGINKWSNENNIDLILHIHFNNYPRKDMKKLESIMAFQFTYLHKI